MLRRRSEQIGKGCPGLVGAGSLLRWGPEGMGRYGKMPKLVCCPVGVGIWGSGGHKTLGLRLGRSQDWYREGN